MPTNILGLCLTNVISRAAMEHKPKKVNFFSSQILRTDGRINNMRALE